MTRRRRARTDREPVGAVLLRGGLVAAALLVVGYLAVSLYSGVPGRDYTYVTAVVPQTGSLIPHDPVRVGGVRKGQVASISTDAQGRGRLRLQLDADTDLPADSTVLLRANGLLGARFVELVPGRSTRRLADGGTVSGGKDSLTFVATDVLDIFDERTRGATKPLISELGTGLLGQGRNVNDALRAASPGIVDFNTLMDRLLVQPEANAALLPALNAMMAPLSDDRVALGELAGETSTALTPFVDRRDGVRESLSAAPPALSAADAGLDRTRPLLQATGALARQARATLPPAPGGLRAATALLDESPAPLRAGAKLLDAAEPAVPAALRITAAARPQLPHLSEIFSDLTPMSRQIGRYGCDLENFGAVFRSMTGFGNRAGGGPAGPAMQFRLQAIAPLPTTALGLPETSGLGTREGLPAPCKYLSKPYDIVARPSAAREGR